MNLRNANEFNVWVSMYPYQDESSLCFNVSVTSIPAILYLLVAFIDANETSTVFYISALS